MSTDQYNPPKIYKVLITIIPKQLYKKPETNSKKTDKITSRQYPDLVFSAGL